jgi:hypothetical protein
MLDHTKDSASMTRHARRRLGRLAPARFRPIVLAAILGVLVVGLAVPTLALAKTFAITGTLDCGLKNGERCDLGDTIKVWTSDVSGNLDNVAIDVSWIKKQLDEDEWDHEDRICLEVQDGAGGTLQATGLILTCDLEGTDNPGKSTRSTTAREQPKPKQEKEDKAQSNDAGAGQAPSGPGATDLVSRINALPCNDVSGGGFECPIPDSLLKEANDAGLRLQFTTPQGCMLVLRPSGAVISCTPRAPLSHGSPDLPRI